MQPAFLHIRALSPLVVSSKTQIYLGLIFLSLCINIVLPIFLLDFNQYLPFFLSFIFRVYLWVYTVVHLTIFFVCVVVYMTNPLLYR